VNVTTKSIKLSDGHMALEPLGSRERGLEARSPVEGVGAFASLDLNELADQL